MPFQGHLPNGSTNKDVRQRESGQPPVIHARVKRRASGQGKQCQGLRGKRICPFPILQQMDGWKPDGPRERDGFLTSGLTHQSSFGGRMSGWLQAKASGWKATRSKENFKNVHKKTFCFFKLMFISLLSVSLLPRVVSDRIKRGDWQNVSKFMANRRQVAKQMLTPSCQWGGERQFVDSRWICVPGRRPLFCLPMGSSLMAAALP